MPLQPLRTILAASAPGAAGRRRPEPRCAACDDLRIVGAACDLETHAVSSPPCAACAADYRPCGHHELDHPAVHACCDCLDGGVVQQRVEGEVVLAGCPAGLRGRHQFRRWARLDLALAGWTLGRWGQTGGADAWAARAARAWVAQLRAADRRPFLVLSGQVGTGKSSLAAAVLREAHDTLGWTGQFRTEPSAVQRFTRAVGADKAQRPDAEDLADVERAFRAVPLLVLDDLGGGRDTPFALERIFDLIDGRSRRLP